MLCQVLSEGNKAQFTLDAILMFKIAVRAVPYLNIKSGSKSGRNHLSVQQAIFQGIPSEIIEILH